MIRTESSGGWQNRDCGIALPYICKKKPNATADPFLMGEQGMTSTGNGQLCNPFGCAPSMVRGCCPYRCPCCPQLAVLGVQSRA